MSDRRTYEQRRPCAVATSLRDLMGPTAGTVALPRGLAWTGRSTYDLDDPADAKVFYERVLVEAVDVDVLARVLDADRLRAYWADLYLPQRVRRSWESRFPELVAAA